MELAMRVIPATSVAVAIVGYALGGAGVGRASPASAEPLDGVYTRTIIDDGPGGSSSGKTSKVTFTPCGPDCIHWDLQGGDGVGFDLHLEGTKWIRTDDGAIVIIDKDSLKGSAALTSGVAGYMTFVLTKDGPNEAPEAQP
jgi:hypothetical protein